MQTLTHLLNQSCQPQPGSAWTPNDVIAQLQVLPGWQYHDSALQKNYAFKNYYATMAFVNAVAFMVHHEDHHPELVVSYNRCVVRFNTHSVNGISLNDFIAAAKTEAIFSQRYGAAQ